MITHRWLFKWWINSIFVICDIILKPVDDENESVNEFPSNLSFVDASHCLFEKKNKVMRNTNNSFYSKNRFAHRLPGIKFRMEEAHEINPFNNIYTWRNVTFNTYCSECMNVRILFLYFFELRSLFAWLMLWFECIMYILIYGDLYTNVLIVGA